MPTRANALVFCVACAAAGCGPYDHWPEPEEVYPYVYTPETDLEQWDPVRWETETWTPSDGKMAGLYLKKLLFPRKGAPAESLRHFELMRPQLPALGTGGSAASCRGRVQEHQVSLVRCQDHTVWCLISGLGA